VSEELRAPAEVVGAQLKLTVNPTKIFHMLPWSLVSLVKSGPGCLEGGKLT